MLQTSDVAWTMLGASVIGALALIGSVLFSSCSLFGSLPAMPAEATPAAAGGLTAPHVVCRCSSTVSGLAWCIEYEGGGIAAAAIPDCTAPAPVTP